MKFFILKSEVGFGNAETNFLYEEGSPMGDAPRCPVCHNYVGLLPLIPPVRLALEGWGIAWGDIAFGSGDEILVSDKLKAAFIAAGLNGFTRFDPATITMVIRRNRSIRDDPPQYLLCTVARSRAMLDDDASGMEREGGPTCPECGEGGLIKRLRQVVLVPGTWSGEDVFIARGLPGTILVTERFKSLCEKEGLTNCPLISAEKYGFDFYF